MGLGQDRTRDPCICSQTITCSQTRYTEGYSESTEPIDAVNILPPVCSITVVPTKSDSDVIFCLQLLSKI